MAMQAFPVLERFVKRQFCRRGLEVIHIKMLQTAQLGIDVAEHRVVGMAGETRVVFGYTVVLEMGSRNILRVINVKALAMGPHDVARQAELR